jgi:hypothetical protein
VAAVIGSVVAARGALVAVRRAGPPPGLIAFQYNPDEMTRRVQARSAAAGNASTAARDETLRLAGAPVETISMAVEFEAADAVATTSGPGAALGVYPQLSALETMLYPASSTVIANAALAAAGTIEVLPAAAPLVLFVWGAGRVLPVRLDGFSITEQAYDAALTPVRARAELELRVLSYDDLPADDPGHHLFLAHQVAKEALAAVGTAVSAAAALPRGLW